MASQYHWSLEQIFEYVTIVDVRKLMPYATERKRRKEADFYQNLINIVHIASYHPPKGRNTDVEKLYNSYNDTDRSYLNAKLDVKGLEALAQRSAAIRAQMAS